MNCYRILQRMVLVSCLLITVVPLYGEQPSSEDDGFSTATAQPSVVAAYKLKNIEANDARKVVSEIFVDSNSKLGRSFRVAVDKKSGLLVVACNAEMHKLVQALISQLDVEPKQGKHDREHAVFRLQNISGNYVSSVLSQLNLEETIYSLNNDQKTLFVAGPPQMIKKIDGVLKAIDLSNDTRIENVQIRLVWLVEAGLTTEDAKKVPQDLREPIAKMSQKIGIGDLRMASQMLVNVNPGSAGEFRSAGTAILNQPCSLDLSGFMETNQGRQSQLQIVISARRGNGKSDLCHLGTKLTVVPGHPVILGMTPIDSQASVFVVQILKKSSSDDSK